MTIRQRHLLRFRWGMLVLLLALVAGSQSLHAQVRRLALPEMVDQAGTIFIGTVTHAQGGTDENGDIVTYTTFKVEQLIKGKAGATIGIKQFGGETAPGKGMLITHMRYFTAGEHVLVMLYPVSSIGFTSPIGLSQGVWRVSANGDVEGVDLDALRGMGTMMQKYGLQSRTSQSIRRSTFVSIVKNLMTQKGRSTR